MQKAGIRKNHVVIDLTAPPAAVQISSRPQVAVASGVVETRVFCLADEKDAYLYYFLLKFPARTMVRVQLIHTNILYACMYVCMYGCM